MSENKYKMFRNYMANELGITKDDIKQWTKDAVQETVEKYLNGIDIEAEAHQALSKAARSIIGVPYSNSEQRIREQIVKELVQQVRISVREPANER